jgi:SAM-dependent methyltransferase
MTIYSAIEYSEKNKCTAKIDLDGDVVYTQNSMGPVKIKEFDPFSNYFMDKAKESQSVLEVGCGYGFMTKRILEGSESIRGYFINDLDESHLAYAVENISDEKKKDLSVIPGAFPKDLSFNNCSLDIVGSICIIHFLTPEMVVKAFKDIYEWLKPGGEFIFVNASIYNKRCSRAKEMLERSNNGKEWAGVVEDFDEMNQEEKDKFPSYFNFSIVEDYERLIKEVGFKIKKLEYFNWREGSPEKSYLGGILVK